MISRAPERRRIIQSRVLSGSALRQTGSAAASPPAGGLPRTHGEVPPQPHGHRSPPPALPRPAGSRGAVRRPRERGQRSRPPAAPSPFPSSSPAAAATARPRPGSGRFPRRRSPVPLLSPRRGSVTSAGPRLCASLHPSSPAAGAPAPPRRAGKGAAHYMAGRDTWAPPPAPARPPWLTIWQPAGTRPPSFPRRPSAEFEAGGG